MTSKQQHGSSDVTPRVAELARQQGSLVERLLELADPELQPPTGGSDRCRAAIRPLWQREVARQHRQRQVRRLWVGGLAAAALLLAVTALLLLNRPAPQGPVATVALVTGPVELVTPEGTLSRLSGDATGAVLAPGSWVQTGQSSRAAVRLGGGQSARLDVQTRLRLVTANRLELSRGGVYIDSGAGGSTGRTGIEVHTAFGTAYEIGTQLEVRTHDNHLSIRVREGTVVLDHGGDELEIHQEHGITIEPDGTVRQSSEPAYGQSWAWVQEVAPPLPIEGITVLRFLDWVSRETGLWIGFAEPEDERFAGATTLHGSIEDLTPAQAPAVVLPGCGMSARQEHGVLMVTRSTKRSQ